MKESALYLRIEESDMITMTYVFGVKTSMNAPNAELRTSILLKWDWNLLENQGTMSCWRPLQKMTKHTASWVNATVLNMLTWDKSFFLFYFLCLLHLSVSTISCLTLFSSVLFSTLSNLPPAWAEMLFNPMDWNLRGRKWGKR